MWLGLGIFLLIMFGTTLFMLGNILGAVLIIAGAIGWIKGLDPKWASVLIAAGIFVFWNPFQFETLQFMR